MLKRILLALFLGGVLISGICFADETLELKTLFGPAGGLWTDQGTYIYPAEAGDTAMVILDDGNVGIGMTGPVARLDVAGSIYSDGGNGDASGDGSVNAFDCTTIARYANGIIASLSREQLANADVDGNGIVTIEDAGILAATLVGYSRQNAERATYNIAYRDGQGSLSATGWSNQSFIVAGVIAPEVDDSYDLGSSSRRWDDVWATNGTIQTSDRRFKENIKDIQYGLDEIMRLRPVSFRWKEKPEKGTQLGLIAQEVQPIIKEVIVVGDDENQTFHMRYERFIPILVKAIQEQQGEINRLKQRIARLERR